MTSMNDHTEVLFANDAFYIAFASRDFDAMDEVWASEGPVTCIHPGWGALLTRQEVMVSWSAILSNDDAPEIVFHHPSVHFSGTTAIVIGYEQVGDATLIATNVFVREADGCGRDVNCFAIPKEHGSAAAAHRDRSKTSSPRLLSRAGERLRASASCLAICTSTARTPNGWKVRRGRRVSNANRAI